MPVLKYAMKKDANKHRLKACLLYTSSDSYIFVRWRNISKHLLTLEGGLYDKVIDVLLENDEIELNKVSNRFDLFRSPR